MIISFFIGLRKNLFALKGVFAKNERGYFRSTFIASSYNYM